MKAPAQTRSPQIPEGTHLAIPYQIFYMGVQKVEWQGTVKYQPKVAITFEFPNIIGEFENKETGQMEKKPKVLSSTYTFSMFKKSNLPKIVKGIVGGKSDEDLENMDLDDILGKPCYVQIEINEKGYSNIISTMTLPVGVTTPALFNPTKIYHFQDEDSKFPPKMFEAFKEKILFAREYQKEVDKKNSAEPKTSRVKEEQTIDYGESINPDDIPF